MKETYQVRGRVFRTFEQAAKCAVSLAVESGEAECIDVQIKGEHQRYINVRADIDED